MVADLVGNCSPGLFHEAGDMSSPHHGSGVIGHTPTITPAKNTLQWKQNTMFQDRLALFGESYLIVK
jgi:hypothetical protein